MIIGITGMPTVGKDTFYNLFLEWATYDSSCKCDPFRISFADAIREDLEHFVKKHYGFDIWKCSSKEKEIIRPLMIYHGKAMREIKPNHWIDKIIPNIKTVLKKGLTPVFTDVRYVNEVKLIQKSGGIVVHLTRKPEKPFPEPDSLELIECFEMCDLTFELSNFDMKSKSIEVLDEYIQHHKKHFQLIVETLGLN